MRTLAQTVDSAKQFLLSKLLEQAQRDEVSLSETEKRMFLFSETSETGPDMGAAEKFDEECDSSEYEAKVAKLLRRAYAPEKKTADGTESWTEALTTLRDQDFYGLVMIDQAGIPRAKFRVVTSTTFRSLFTAFSASDVLFVCAELAIIGIGSIVVFQPFRLHLNLPDWLRLVLLALFAGLCWVVGDIHSRTQFAKAVANARNRAPNNPRG